MNDRIFAIFDARQLPHLDDSITLRLTHHYDVNSAASYRPRLVHRRTFTCPSALIRSVAPFQELHRPPPLDELLVRLGGRVGVAAGQRGQTGRDQPGRVVLAQDRRRTAGRPARRSPARRPSGGGTPPATGRVSSTASVIGASPSVRRSTDMRPVGPPAGLGDLGAVAQHPPLRVAAKLRSSRSTKTNQRSGTPQVAICSCTRGTPRSSTRSPLRQSSTTVWAWPASTGGTNASASTLGTPSRAFSAASATRMRRFHGQTSSVSSASRTYASSGRSGSRVQPAPSASSTAVALPARALGRRDRPALLDVAAPEDLAVAVEGGQRLVNPQVRREQ